MTGQQAVSILTKDLGLGMAESAGLLGVHPNTIYNWSVGKEISPGMARFVCLLKARPELIEVLRRMVKGLPLSIELANVD